VAIGRSGNSSEWDATGIYNRRAFGALFSPIYRASARLFTATGSLGDAAVDGHIGQLQADHPVVGF
jgi:hypothetical protein